jgi:hypothetical protein
MITPQELTQQLEQRRAEVEALQVMWNDLLPEYRISAYQLRVWLRLHPFARIVAAVEKTAKKSARLGGQMDKEYVIKFCSSVANNLKTEQGQGAAA